MLISSLLYTYSCTIYMHQNYMHVASSIVSTPVSSVNQMASQQTRKVSEQEKKGLDQRAAQGETVVPGGTRGKSLEAQERLAEGRSKGGQTRKEQLGTEGYKEMGKKGGQTTGGKGEEEEED